MDMAKSYYAYTIQKDSTIPGTVVRCTTIPEDLGRISYLLTDKTGTLTQNEMIFKRLVLATTQADSPDDVRVKLKQGLGQGYLKETHHRINEIDRVTNAVKALGICHNVTPVYEEQVDEESMFGIEPEVTYQASSPDEVRFQLYKQSAYKTPVLIMCRYYRSL